MFCFSTEPQGKDWIFVVFVVVWLHVFGGVCAYICVSYKTTSKDKIFGALGKSQIILA